MFSGLILLVWVALVILLLGGVWVEFRPWSPAVSLLLVILYILISHGGGIGK